METENSLVLEILQDIENNKIKTALEIEQEIKQRLYQVYRPFLNFPSNQENFAEVFDRLRGYEFAEVKELQEGDYIRYLNPKYFYDIQLMKGGFISDINKKKKQITLVNKNKIIKIIYPKLTLFRKLDEGDIIKLKIMTSWLKD